MLLTVFCAFALLSTCWTTCGDAARILGVFPVGAYSHYALGSTLMKALAEKGHDVAIISPFKEKNPPKNYREVYMDGIIKEAEEEKKKFFEVLDQPPHIILYIMDAIGLQFTEKALSHEAVQKLLKNPNEKFDLIIVEQFVNDALKALGYHFNAPVVVLSTIGSGPWVNGLVGNPAPRSYVPDFHLNYSPQMNFWQRMHNGLFGILEQLIWRYHLNPKMNELVQKYFPGAPSVEELNANVSLVLLNSHVSTNQPVPHVPNMIEIGGFHVQPPKKLPQDLQKYLDEAKQGVIYFSMGSNLQSKDLPEEKKNSILNAFSKVKLNVLWKFEDDTLSGLPKNVKLVKWAPQQDILAHPNVKLFITHGGLLSTIETIYHGVPILGIPMFGDQKMNMANAVLLGFAQKLDFNELTEETLLNGINEILQNPEYTENVKKRSAIMKDQPIPPLDNAVFWTEYVIRHRGAPHFRSASLDLTWYEYYMVDVIAFIIAVAVLVLAILYYALFRLCCSTKKTDKKISVDRKKKQK